MDCALAGDERAFGDLACRHRAAMICIAAAIVGVDLAEEAVQDAFFAACRTLPTLQDRHSFFRWLAAITRSRALTAWRSERRHARGRVPFDDARFMTRPQASGAPGGAREACDVVVATLGRIPVEYAEVIRLHCLEGLPHQEIADLVGVSVATVRWRCFRARELLREALSGIPGLGIPPLGPPRLGGRPGGIVLDGGAGPRPRRPAERPPR